MRYTHIVEYDGGTYLYQISANSPVEALELSRDNDFPGIEVYLTKDIVEYLFPVSGLEGVWCYTDLDEEKDELIMIHTVASQEV